MRSRRASCASRSTPHRRPLPRRLRNVKLASDVVLQRRPCKVIGFVSVLPHEGKTTVAANFAGLLAANGVRTLLIDGDLRNPGLSRSLSAAPEKGLVEAIVGEHRWQSAVMVDQQDQARDHSGRVSGPSVAHRANCSPDPACATSSPRRASLRLHHRRSAAVGPGGRREGICAACRRIGPGGRMGRHAARAWCARRCNAEPRVAAKVLGLVLNKTDMKQLARYGAFGSAEQYFDRYAAVLHGPDRHERQSRSLTTEKTRRSTVQFVRKRPASCQIRTAVSLPL